MDDIFSSQEAISTDMANHLSGLTRHYDQMVQALHESEAGESFSEDDIQGEYMAYHEKQYSHSGRDES